MLSKVENLSISVSKLNRKKGNIVGKLNHLLLDVVDETFRQVFKEEGAKVIYDFLENNSCLKRDEIAEKPEVFSDGLEGLLVSAAPVIEKMILENLYYKVKLKFEEKEGYRFSDYVKELKEKCRC